MPKITQLVSGGGKIQTQLIWFLCYTNQRTMGKAQGCSPPLGKGWGLRVGATMGEKAGKDCELVCEGSERLS